MKMPHKCIIFTLTLYRYLFISNKLILDTHCGIITVHGGGGPIFKDFMVTPHKRNEFSDELRQSLFNIVIV